MGITDDLCVIQDRALRTEIGAGILADDVFRYSRAQAFHTFVFSFDLFHKHLGYSSLFVMNTIKCVSFDSNNVLYNFSVSSSQTNT